MLTKRIQIYTNRVSIDPAYLAAMFTYYKSHGVVLNYDITPVDIHGYQSVQRQMALGGAWVYVLRGAETLVPQTDHDIVIFAFDLSEWKAPWYWPFPLRSDTPRNDCEIVNGKPFINLGVYDKESTQMAFLHEPFHALNKIYNVPDQLDNYIKNNTSQYQDPDSSMSIQWSIFNKYMPLDSPASPVTSTSVPHVTLTRLLDNGVETIGKLEASNNGATFTCSTLELPWKNNQHDISCIPKGDYRCSVQPFHNTHMYELSNTAPRTGIFVHAGNFNKDSLGCILLGVRPSDINGDGQVDVTSSVSTVAAFMGFMHNGDFTLTIN